MYYLLETNKILSDEYCRKYINYEDRENEYVTYVGSDGDMLIEEYFTNGCRRILTVSRVIKKSENVYDLIEVGDLAKREGIILEVTEIQTFDDETEKEFIFDSFLNSCCESDIQAIYKPNSKGDYIKVWEKI